MSIFKTTRNLLMMSALGCCLSVLPCFADSQARIVRLSEVQGNVQIDRNTGQGYEKAFMNLPITQGVKIQTKANGRASVEFEDGGILRLAPESVVTFSQLSLRDSGAKASTVDVQEGTVYVNFASIEKDEFTLTFGQEKLTQAKAAHFRLSLGDTDAKVAVFSGEVKIAGPSETVDVGKNQTEAFDFTDKDRSKLAKSVEPEPYDAWDKQQDQYEQNYTKTASSSYSPYAYGMSDLNYYGSFFTAPGYGMLWQPYFVGAGWDPFMMGSWAYYPGFGYGWVSGYPWGWTPFHYGSWAFVPPYGWAWQPGGAWVGYYGIPAIVNPPANFQTPQPPGSGHGVVAVNRGPQAGVVGGGFVGRRLEIRNNSAGLGIGRGEVDDLKYLSQTVEKKGVATTSFHPAAIGVPSMWQREYGGGAAMGNNRNGIAPANAGPANMGPAPSGHPAVGGGHANPK